MGHTEVKEGKQFGALEGGLLAGAGIIGIGVVAFLNLRASGVHSFDVSLMTDKIVVGMIVGAVMLGVSVTSFVCKKVK